MFKRLAKFRSLEPRRMAPGPREAMHSNDNLPGFRRPGGERRIPSPALACHWFDRNGRLECRWLAETHTDAPPDHIDRHQPPAAGPAHGQPRSPPRGRGLTLAG
jgi:hypothetical protein